MPEPLATPITFTVPDPARNVQQATFGRVSVVMIARAKPIAASGVADFCEIRSGSAARIFCSGNGTPITPVEEGITAQALALRIAAVQQQICSHAQSPCAPVAQFAFPELTSSART